jgi:hypothetical protein
MPVELRRKPRWVEVEMDNLTARASRERCWKASLPYSNLPSLL